MSTKGWRIACAVILGLSLWVATQPASADDSSVLCTTVRPLINGGYSTVLGTYGEGGIRCPRGPWTVQLGWRYTELEQGANPFGILSYDTVLNPEWHLFVTGSVREHIGDYEVDRLPETTLRWTPLPNSFIIPTIDLSAGWISTVVPLAGQTVRTGGLGTLSTQPIPVGSVTLSASYQFGDYFYGSGQSMDYWTGVVSAYTPLSPSTTLGLTYVHQEGFGVSPLVYDFVSYDNLAWASFAAAVSPQVTLTFATEFNINVPGYSGPTREYTITYSKVSEGWSIGVGWYVPTSKPFLLGTLPQ